MSKLVLAKLLADDVILSTNDGISNFVKIKEKIIEYIENSTLSLEGKKPLTHHMQEYANARETTPAAIAHVLSVLIKGI